MNETALLKPKQPSPNRNVENAGKLLIGYGASKLSKLSQVSGLLEKRIQSGPFLVPDCALTATLVFRELLKLLLGELAKLIHASPSISNHLSHSLTHFLHN
jgi:hypothetical protein